MQEKEIYRLLIKGNLKYQEQVFDPAVTKEKIPKYPILILTCMDPRIDIYRIFNFHPGDIFILRNAGNILTKDMLRSIYIAISEFNVEYIVVLGHLDCGMTKIKLHELKAKLGMNLTQAELRDYFKPFADELMNISNQVEKLKHNRIISSKVEISGMLYDVKTGFIFESEMIERFQFIEQFYKNYDDLVMHKRAIQNEEIIKEREEARLSENLKSLTIKPTEDHTNNNIPENIAVEKSRDEAIQYHLNNDKPLMFRNYMAFIKMPKITIPKIKIHVPQLYKKKSQK